MIIAFRHPGVLTQTFLALFFVSLLASSEASAFQRNLTRTGANGTTATKGITTTRTENGYTRDVLATGPQGKSATRSAQGQWDASNKTWNRTATSTGPNGGTMTGSATTTRTGNGYTRDSAVTGPQGNTVSRSAQGQWDPATKTWSKTVATAGGN